MRTKSTAETLVHLSTSEMQRMPKPRAGFEPWAAQLIALAKQNPRLQSTTFDGDALLEELEIPQALRVEIAQTAKKLSMLRETQLQHASNVWLAVLRIYERAKVEAKDDAEVEFAIAGFEAFMKTGRRKSQATPVSAPSAAASTA